MTIRNRVAVRNSATIRNSVIRLLVGLVLTVMTGPGGSARAQTALPANLPPTPQPARPVADSVVEQAGEHAEGNFTNMMRASIGGQIQKAWDDAEHGAGIFQFELCDICTYKVRLREHMVTVIELPEGEVIERADVGDGRSFDVKSRGPRRLAIKPLGFGVDTNLMIYGTSGLIYSIYLRAESFNSKLIPDLLVQIIGDLDRSRVAVVGLGMVAEQGEGVLVPEGNSGAHPSLQPGKAVYDAVTGLEVPSPDRRDGDFVQEAPFDPDALRGWGDYKLWAGGPDGETLRPETVFRDDHFTYLRFGDRWNDMELPTAYVVVDDIDELVNTRVQGHTFIVESTRPLITLKSGLSYLCIEYEGGT